MPTVRVFPPPKLQSGYVSIAARRCSLSSADVEPVASGSSHGFLICFLYSDDLPVNHALMRLYPEFNWRGELVVMRMSPSSPHRFVTNMGGRVFAGLAEEAIIAQPHVRFLKLARSLESEGKSIPEDLPTHMHHKHDPTPVQAEDEQVEN
ncbi:hypothetical protein FA95DRAFT_1578554 [Auriscalpium vulgare]|uniref:Uncharacterized protein n=1 Tax=Auriscalpium vulgare TaxID=40419 RepID=A0ACB8R1U4_9AGAM|nr:hypothetical protein FA95DRAFT_1578554 [Auriscalpium vulgare]